MAYIETSIKCNLDKKHFLPSDYRDPGNVARSKPSPINSNAWTPCPTVLGRGSSSGKNKKERKKGRKQIVVWFIPSITMELPTRSKLLPTSISARVYFRSEFDQPWRFKSLMRTRHWPRRTSNCIKTRLFAFAYLRDTKY